MKNVIRPVVAKKVTKIVEHFEWIERHVDVEYTVQCTLIRIGADLVIFNNVELNHNVELQLKISNKILLSENTNRKIWFL